MEILLNSVPKGISGFVREGEVTLPPGAIGWSKVPYVKGFIDRQSDKFVIKATLKAGLVFPCDRCLDPHEEYIQDEFTLIIFIEEQSGQSDDEDDSILSYPADDILKLEDTVFRTIVLNLPMKALCRDDCKGICPNCGNNLNYGLCTCEQEKVDPRWEALKILKSSR